MRAEGSGLRENRGGCAPTLRWRTLRAGVIRGDAESRARAVSSAGWAWFVRDREVVEGIYGAGDQPADRPEGSAVAGRVLGPVDPQRAALFQGGGIYPGKPDEGQAARWAVYFGERVSKGERTFQSAVFRPSRVGKPALPWALNGERTFQSAVFKPRRVGKPALP